MAKSKLMKSAEKVLKDANKKVKPLKSAKEIERQKREELVLEVHKELNTGKDFVIMFDEKDRFKVLGKMDDQTIIENLELIWTEPLARA